MAAMSTTLVTLSVQGSTITYALPASTPALPFELVQKKSPAIGKKRTSTDSLRFVASAVDADGNMVPEKTSFEVNVIRAAYGTQAELVTLKTYVQDIIMSDEYWNNLYAKSWPIKSI